MLDINHNENYVLGLESAGYDPGECITCIAYSSFKGEYLNARIKYNGTATVSSLMSSFVGILAGGTNLGKIAMWHSLKNNTGADIDGEKKWEISSPSVIQEPVYHLQV